MSYKTIRSLLSYQGSKYRLIPELRSLMPACDIFHDVFGGSGTVGINMLDKSHIVRYNEIDRNVFSVLRRLQSAGNPRQIADGLDYHVEKWGLGKGTSAKDALKKEKAFYAFRDYYNENPGPFKLWVLSKHAFSSLIRFNGSGEFNYSWGKRGFVEGKDRTNKITKWLESFKQVRMSRMSYQRYLKRTLYNAEYMNRNKYQIFYFDPPYLASGDNVYAGDWSEGLEEELLNHLQYMLDNNIKFMLSNVLKHRRHVNNLLIRWIKNNSSNLNVRFPEFTGKGQAYVLNRASDSGKSNNTIEVIVTNLCTEI